MYVSLPSCGA